jgi:hypothetical protein
MTRKSFARKRKSKKKKREPGAVLFNKPVNTPPSQKGPSSNSLIMQLHQTIGNQAVQRLIQSGALQLEADSIQPGDTYSQEVDRLVQRVESHFPSREQHLPGSVDSNFHAAIHRSPGSPKINLDVIQREINIGLEPKTPPNFRTTTTANGYSNACAGGKPFWDYQKVLANNRSKAPKNQSITLKKGQYPVSDESGNSLIPREVVSGLEPEVDHIVTRDDWGSNAWENARVLSKTENTSPFTSRPKIPGGVVLRAYKNYEDQSNPHFGAEISEGRPIALYDARQLYQWATGKKNAAEKTIYTDLGSIINMRPKKKQNGIKIVEG